jgi:hypothetical protein
MTTSSFSLCLLKHNNQLMMVTHEGQSVIGERKSGGEKGGMEEHHVNVNVKANIETW